MYSNVHDTCKYIEADLISFDKILEQKRIHSNYFFRRKKKKKRKEKSIDHSSSVTACRIAPLDRRHAPQTSPPCPPLAAIKRDGGKHVPCALAAR